jgi:L-serine dehydratase
MHHVAYLSLFTVLRPGPGPSSMHTAGPWLAARRFVHDLAASGHLPGVARLGVELYGGAACVGREAAADSAIVAGLQGVERAQCDAVSLSTLHAATASRRAIRLDGHHPVRFDPAADIGFRVDRALAYGGSAVRFAAFDAHGTALADRVYVPIGDDEVVGSGESAGARGAMRVPYGYEASADALIEACRLAGGRRLAFVALANEGALASPGEVRSRLLAMAAAMRTSIERGCQRDGALPSGRKRTAAALARSLPASTVTDAQRCRVYALAAAEENAAGELAVAAPSNGAAGVVAALLRLALESDRRPDDAEVDFLAVAGATGALLRRAGLRQVGCQGEIGVAAAMAAAGYASSQGATPAQALHAAELALEPHLGLACDPVAGRIESPCIERNGLAAARACAAAGQALRVPAPRVALDAVVQSMVESSRALAGRYKQASLGGVAMSVPDC